MSVTRPAILALAICFCASPAAAGDVLTFGAMGDETTQAPPPEKPYKKKKVFLAFLMSAVLPSSGQFYNGEYEKAVLQLSLIAGGLVIHFMSSEEGDKEILGDPGLVIVAITWAWSMFDAPSSAYRINEENKRNAGIPTARAPANRWDVFGQVSPDFDAGRAGVLVRF